MVHDAVAAFGVSGRQKRVAGNRIPTVYGNFDIDFDLADISQPSIALHVPCELGLLSVFYNYLMLIIGACNAMLCRFLDFRTPSTNSASSSQAASLATRRARLRARTLSVR